MITIESQDRRWRVTAEECEGEDSVRVTFYRHAGAINAPEGAQRWWSRRETGIVDLAELGIPFHVFRDRLADQVWKMVDDRPRAWPSQQERQRPISVI